LNPHESRNNLLSNARAFFNPLFQKMNIFQTALETEHGIFFANVQHENKKVLDIKLHPVIDGAIFPPASDGNVYAWRIRRKGRENA